MEVYCRRKEKLSQILYPPKTSDGALLEKISDVSYCKIIESTEGDWMTVNKISEKASMSVSSVYRRISHLIDHKLIAVSGELTQRGKRALYKSKIKITYKRMNDDSFQVEIVPNNPHEVKSCT